MDETLGLGPPQISRAPSTSKIINLEDIFSFNSSKKQQITRSKIFTETPTITKDILSNIPTFRGEDPPKSSDDFPKQIPTDRFEASPINHANSIHRISSYLDNYEYSEHRMPENYANMVPNQQQISPLKEIKEPMVSSASGGGNISLFEDIAQHYDLQKEIDHSMPGGKLKLPNSIVRVQNLRIVKPINIIGSPNSTIEVENGIHVDLSGFKKHGKAVVFSECRIVFEYSNKKIMHSQLISTKRLDRSEYYQTNDRKSYSEAHSHFLGGQMLTTEAVNKTSRGYTDHKIYPLFTIYQNSCLEIRDCSITSGNLGENNGPGIQDVCFYLKGLNPNEMHLWNRETQPTLYIQSTMIRSFFQAIQSAQMGRILMDKVFVSECNNHAVDILNPFVFEMRECVVENCKKSCINLRFSKGFQGLGQVERRVLVRQSEFKKVKSYGISIFGDNMNFQNCQIEIGENKMMSCAKDGIGIKNLNVKSVLVEKNEVTGSSGNGIFLQNILDINSFSQVLVKSNKIMKSQLYGMVVMNAGVYSETNEITENMKGGLLISDGGDKEIQNEDFYKQYALRNIFNCDNIHQNSDSGVIIIGGGKGPIIFNACQLQLNATNGLYIKQDQEGSLSTKTTGTDEGAKSARGGGESNRDILLDKCNISENLMSGVYVKSLIHPLYSKETMIYGNNSFAVYIQRAEDKGKVVFKGETKNSKLKEYVSGQVGGAWGLINEKGGNSHSVCKRPACNIF